MKRSVSFCFLVVLSLFANAGALSASEAAEVSNRVVAFVNNDVITLHELNNKIREMTGAEPSDLEMRDSKKFYQMRRNILEQMINNKITMEKVKELKIEVAPKEVDAAIERIRNLNSLSHDDLIAYLKERNIDYLSYREIVRKDMERMRLITMEVNSKIIIKEEDIQEYYDSKKEDYKIPGKVHLAGIFFTQEDPSDEAGGKSLMMKAQDIMVRIQNGEDFSDLARKFSMGPGAAEGGDLGVFKISQLAPELKEAVDKLSPGDVSGPISGPGRVQIIKLIERQDVKIKTLNEVRDAIYDILYKEEVNRRYSDWIKELRSKSYTKIIL